MTPHHPNPIDFLAVAAGGLLLVAALVRASAPAWTWLRLRLRLTRLFVVALLVLLIWAAITNLPDRKGNQSMLPDQFLAASASYDPTPNLRNRRNSTMTTTARLTSSPWAQVDDSGHGQLDISRPHPARRYDYWLGGKDNFAADRSSADQIAEVFPPIRTAVRENRRFLQRVVSFLTAEAGIHQFLDIGAGLPASPNVHEIAQAIAPASRIVYVDNDPIVITHGQGRTTSTPQGAINHIQADLRNPQSILTHPTLHTTLDPSQPVGLLLTAVLHFLDDHDRPDTAVSQLLRALPSGSYLALSHATLDLLPSDTSARLTTIAATGTHGVFRPRTHAEIAAFLDDLELVDPGLVPIVRWRPGQTPTPEAAAAESPLYGAVGRLS